MAADLREAIEFPEGLEDGFGLPKIIVVGCGGAGNKHHKPSGQNRHGRRKDSSHTDTLSRLREYRVSSAGDYVCIPHTKFRER
jgi:hypothetical protein